MPTTQDQLDTGIRRQVFVEGFKASEVKRYETFLKKIDKSLRMQLSKDNLTEFGRAKLRSELKKTREYLDEIFKEWEGEYGEELVDFSVDEADFELQTLQNQAPSGFSFSQPSNPQLKAAVFATPLSVRGPYQGALLKPFTKEFSETQKRHITGAIRQGFYEGKTNAEILRTIRGTKANNFKDGILNVSKNNATAIIRTGVQHTAGVARHEVWKNNEDIVPRYEWVSTLDSRTSQTCRSLDGMIFEHGKGPREPVHISCRSRTIGVFSEEFDFLNEKDVRSSKGAEGGAQVEDESYYDWLKKQPKSFQESAIGPARTKLLRDGGLSSTEFAKLNIGKNFQPLTLEAMKDKNPVAFGKAGLTKAAPVVKPKAKTPPKPKPKPKQKPKQSSFTPAKSSEEVIERLSSAGVGEINLGTMKLSEQNAVLDAFESEAAISGPLKLNRLDGFRRPRARYEAFYSPSNNAIGINISKIGKVFNRDIKPFKHRLKELNTTLKKWEDEYLGVAGYNQTKVRNGMNKFRRKISDVEEQIARGESPRSWGVTELMTTREEAIKTTVIHEIGHYRRDFEKWGRNFDKSTGYSINPYVKAPKGFAVTEYADSNIDEYFAESYAWFRMKGEKGLADDVAKTIREGL